MRRNNRKTKRNTEQFGGAGGGISTGRFASIICTVWPERMQTKAEDEMEKTLDLQEIRTRIDAVDAQLTALLLERMALCKQVAQVKIAKGLPVLDAGREAIVLEKNAQRANAPQEQETLREVYRTIMEQSRQMQTRLMKEAQQSC